MATDSKAAKGKKSTLDEDDEDDIDLGASSLPRASLKSPKENFEMVNLDADEEDENDVDVKRPDDRRKKRFIKKKKKKEQLSDSSSEDESGREGSAMEDINPSDLTWPLYLWYYMVAVSTGALKAAEYLGEKLAYFFGITSPKYQHVIDEYYRLKELEREEEEREMREKEYVAKVEAERIKNLEGGEKSSEILTISEENNKLPTTTTTTLP